jgi:hypothetical protein
MLEPIYFPSGITEEVWLSDDSSHAEDTVRVKDRGGVMWGPLEAPDALDWPARKAMFKMRSVLPY